MQEAESLVIAVRFILVDIFKMNVAAPETYNVGTGLVVW
jgi:hypothetical protein